MALTEVHRWSFRDKVTTDWNKLLFQHLFLKNRVHFVACRKGYCLSKVNACYILLFPELGRSLTQTNLLQICSWLCYEQKWAFLKYFFEINQHIAMCIVEKRQARTHVEGPPSSSPSWSHARSAEVKDPVLHLSQPLAVPSRSILICRANHVGFLLCTALFR